jgi:thioesterase domain-containing protein
MAHQIATDASITPKFRVLGIVMIDSVGPRKISDIAGAAKFWPTERVDKSPEEVRAMPLKDKVDLNMTHARVMLQRWDLPKWNGQSVPPTILLRAKDPVDGEAQSFVDIARHDRLLGWGPYNEENGHFIRRVVDINGHHFSIFHEEYVSLQQRTRLRVRYEDCRS